MIIVVEDDRGIRELVVYTLQNTGFKAVGCENARELYSVLKTEKPQLVLLDIMLPGEDGISILKRLRYNAATKKLPVIMLTAKGAEFDKVVGLDAGADDYIAKPFGMMEMISRIKAVLRRAEETEDIVYSVSNILLNVKAHQITVNNAPVEVTLKEFELLRLLMKNAGTVLTRDMLLENIWGYGFDGETRTVDVHIGTLRAKLGESGEIIETVRGIGYRIANEF